MGVDASIFTAVVWVLIVSAASAEEGGRSTADPSMTLIPFLQRHAGVSVPGSSAITFPRFFCYYAPLFTAVWVLTLVLRRLPDLKEEKHPWFFKFIGATLWTLAGLWILPVGVLGPLSRREKGDSKNSK